MNRLAKKTLALTMAAALAVPAGLQEEVLYGEEKTQDETVVYADGTALSEVESADLTSPDGKTEVRLWKSQEGKLYYSVSQNGREVLAASALGIEMENRDYTTGLSVGEVRIGDVKTDSYDLPAGGCAHVEDSYREMTVDLAAGGGQSGSQIIFRSYNDGIAYRYQLKGNAGEKEKVLGEASEYMIPQESAKLWLGGTNNTYEVDYKAFSGQYLKNSGAKYTVPALAQVADGKEWVLMTEANVFNETEPYCSSYLKSETGKTNLKVQFGNKVGNVTMSYQDGMFHTPWRVAVVTDNLNDLFDSHLVSDLNPAADEETYQYSKWVKSFKADWSWWSEAGDDPIEYGPQKDYIDFAAENGWDAVCLDFGWCLWSDYRTKVKELCDYASAKGVKIMLWYGVNNTAHASRKDAQNKPAYPTYSLRTAEQLEEQFAWAEDAGVYAVKVDYYESDSQDTMKQMQQCAQIAAKHRLCVLFHGCTLPGGENRTYPNILSYEAVFGEEYHKFGLGSPTVFTLLSYPYTRNVAGSMDFTPAVLPVTAIPATAGFQLAETAVFESGTLNLASSIYAYEGNPALGFLNQIESSFAESRLVDEKNAAPGEYVATARKSKVSDKWFIGAMTAKKRTTEIALDFLGEGTYHAAIYRDNEDGSAVVCETKEVTKDSVIREELKENGGMAMVIAKDELTQPEEKRSYYEMEDDKLVALSDGAVIGTNPFASGLRQVTLGYGKSSSASIEVQVPDTGIYELYLFYKAGTDSQLAYSINGGEGIKTGRICSGTNSIARISAYVSLNAGKNTITFYNPNANFVGLDRIAVSKSPTEGKEATRSDETDYGFSAGDENQKYSFTSYKAIDGTTNAVKEKDGYVGWLGGKPESYLDVKVTAKKAGVYKLRLGYMTAVDRDVCIGVNGKEPARYSCKPTGGYNTDSLGYAFFDVELDEGENVIRLTNPSGDCPNIYSIGISEEQIENSADEKTDSGDKTENADKTDSEKQEKEESSKTAEDKKTQVKVVPAKTKILRLKAKKGGFTLKVKKTKAVSGYEIAYAPGKKFSKKKAKTVITAKNKISVGRLKAKKVYCVRVRTFKKVGKKKYYSGWTAVKKIKTK